MFRRYVEPCGSSAVHAAHKRWNRDLDRIQCWGVRKDAITDPWRAANPSIGGRVLDQLYFDSLTMEPHFKHQYKLAHTLIMPKGESVSNHNVYWQCDFPNCGRVYFVNRQDLYEELTRNQVDQTWPG